MQEGAGLHFGFRPVIQTNSTKCLTEGYELSVLLCQTEEQDSKFHFKLLPSNDTHRISLVTCPSLDRGLRSTF
jgi:hypothetical protein